MHCSSIKFMLAVLLVTVLFMIGCSGGGTSPTTPANMPVQPVAERDVDSERHLWGIWDISFDPIEMEVIIEPVRNVQGHFNITNMVIPPACDDCVEIAVNSFDPVTRILDADVTLRNPTAISGKDVRGILFTNDLGHLLTNPDDWTDLYDVAGGEDVNPFKAFAKTNPQRVFAGFQQHTENYLVYIPIPPKFAAIRYAVDACWPGNAKEPYSIENFAQLGELFGITGSAVDLQVDVHDWQADHGPVTLEVPDITGIASVELNHIGSDVYTVEIVNATGAPAGDYEARIVAKSANSGELALYDYVTITISEPGGWTRTWGSVDTYELADDLAVAASGDVYICGLFEDTVDFDPGPDAYELTSSGGEDVFLTKFDEFGNFQWARAWGGAMGDDWGSGVACDSAGNAYATGFYRNTVDFDPGPGEDIHTSAGSNDAFLVKFDPDGNFVWAKTWGGTSEEWGRTVVFDDADDVYVAGTFRSETDFDPGVGEDIQNSAGVDDCFLTKFDSDGYHQWARTWGGPSADAPHRIAVGGMGGIYITGKFQLTCDFKPGPETEEHTSAGEQDAFLSKFLANGDYQWVSTWGGTEKDWPLGVGADSSDNAYVTGQFEGTTDLDPDPVGTQEHTSNGETDVFLSKFSSSGDYQWGLAWGGINFDLGWAPLVDSSDDLLLFSSFRLTVDIDPGPEEYQISSNGGYDIALSKFNPAGEFQWVVQIGGSGNDNFIYGDIDNSDYLYGTGGFTDTTDFDPGPGVDEHTAVAGLDYFVFKLRPDGYY